MISIISDTFECPPPALIFIRQVDSCHPALQVSGWPRNGHLHSEPSDRGGKSPQPRPQASEREECGFCKFDNSIVLPSNQSKVSSVWSHQEVHHIYFPAGKIFEEFRLFFMGLVYFYIQVVRTASMTIDQKILIWF